MNLEKIIWNICKWFMIIVSVFTVFNETGYFTTLVIIFLVVRGNIVGTWVSKTTDLLKTISRKIR